MHPFPNPYPERYFNQNEFACIAARADVTTDFVTNTDLSKNCLYYDQYSYLNRNEGMFRDSENLYTRGWFQTFNLLIGIVFLGIQIYREQSLNVVQKK